MATELQQLQAEFLDAARTGAEHAGHAGVAAGVQHADGSGRALFNVDRVDSSFAGPLDATVTASQPDGITPYGPSLASSGEIADEMAYTAAAAGQQAVFGGRHQ